MMTRCRRLACEGALCLTVAVGCGGTVEASGGTDLTSGGGAWNTSAGGTNAAGAGGTVAPGALGGSATGGLATGGLATGGLATGGLATGGLATGGLATGGLATGGRNAGGLSGVGGTAATRSITTDPQFVLFSLTLGKEGIAGASAAPPLGDLTASAVAVQDPSVSAPCKGDTDMGSLRLVVPFSAYSQYVDYQFVLDGPVDFSNRTLYLWLRYDDGFNPDVSSPGGIVFHATSSDIWARGQAEWRNIDRARMGEWLQVAFNLEMPELVSSAGFDPSQLRAIGFMIHTGDNSPGVTAMPATGSFHIDCIGWSQNS